MTGVSAFGRMWRASTRRRFAPTATAPSTNGRAASARTSPCTSLAMPIHPVSPSTAMTNIVLGCHSAASNSSSTTRGTASAKSVSPSSVRDRAPPVAGHATDDDADDERDQHREDADPQRNTSPIDETSPHITAEAVRAERVEDAMRVTRERRNEPRCNDVVLYVRIAIRHERGRQSAQDDDEQHAEPEHAAPIPQEPRHAVRLRIRGSSQAARASASMLPATTSTALTVVAAMTTG